MTLTKSLHQKDIDKLIRELQEEINKINLETKNK